MTSTRLRSLLGRSCRKTDFQTCVSVSQFQNRTVIPSWGAIVFVSAMVSYNTPYVASGFSRTAVRLKADPTSETPSRLQKRFRVDPLSELVLEMLPLVHED